MWPLLQKTPMLICPSLCIFALHIRGYFGYSNFFWCVAFLDAVFDITLPAFFQAVSCLHPVILTDIETHTILSEVY